MTLSEMDSYYDEVNTLLKKLIFNEIPLEPNEKKELRSIIDKFEKLECDKDEEICNAGGCNFACNPADWVKFMGFDNLCDLVFNYMDNGPILKPPKGDAMNIIVNGHGFSRQ